MAEFSSPYNVRDKVHIDGDESIVAYVVGFCWENGESGKVQVSWLHNGDAKLVWLEEWRITRSRK